MWLVSSCSGVATLRTAIHLLLTYLLTYKWGQLTPSPGKMDENLKSENMQKEQFSGWGVKAGVENGAMLTTYLFRYTSECTIS